MSFVIVNNRAIRFFRKGVAMYNPSEFDMLTLVPISKIACVHKIGRLVQIELVNNVMLSDQYETTAEAEAQFAILEKLLTAQTTRNDSGGPLPDSWAMEQLK